MITKATEEIKVTRTYEFSGTELLALLSKQPNVLLPHGKVSLTVHIPGGGDYSNTELDLTETVVTLTTEFVHTREKP